MRVYCKLSDKYVLMKSKISYANAKHNNGLTNLLYPVMPVVHQWDERINRYHYDVAFYKERKLYCASTRYNYGFSKIEINQHIRYLNFLNCATNKSL